MARPTSEETAAFIETLARVLSSRPVAVFERVGGEVALVVVGHSPEAWIVWVGDAKTVEVVPGTSVKPIVKIGIKPSALRWLLEGTLNVERAFETRRLAVEGDLGALARFAQCFLPGGSLTGVRATH